MVRIVGTACPAGRRVPRTSEGRRARIAQEFHRGDRVRWRSHGGHATGEVLRKITADTEVKGHTVRASADDPQYLVRSEKSGGEAAHKPSALEKL